MSEERYIDYNERANAVNGLGAGVLSALMLAWLWGTWRLFILVGLVQASVVTFNVFVNKVGLRRWGVRRVEMVRAAVNLTSGVVVNHISGYPLPSWLFLPFVALAYDHLGRKIARIVLFSLCATETIAAAIDGVPLKYPLAFTVFAVFCALVNDARFRVIRGMLLDADAHREELRRQIEARELAERELVQAQKLEAVGRLAAGLAHEINTPVQFVGDSLDFVKESTVKLFAAIDALSRGERVGPDTELEYLRENVPSALAMSAQGLDRVAAIVRSMRLFSRPDSSEMANVDLNAAVEATLVIASPEYRYVAEVETALGEVPTVRGHAGEINQVILNLLVNAAHAIAAAREPDAPLGRITVRTWCEAPFAYLRVSDTGCGIRESIRTKVFDPFFTTKEIGRGTGQGLSVVRNFVLEHGGDVGFESEVGHGTVFTIRLPCSGGTVSAAVA